MRTSEPMIRTVEISEAQRQLAPLANEVARREIRVIVEESGAPLAALVSLHDLERLAEIGRDREAQFAVVDRMRAAFADISSKEIEREVARALDEVRAEMDAEHSGSDKAE